MTNRTDNPAEPINLTDQQADALLYALDCHLDILIDDHYEGADHTQQVAILADIYDKVALAHDLDFRADAHRRAITDEEMPNGYEPSTH